MDEMVPPQSAAGLVAGSITPFITTLSSELQLRPQSHSQVVVGDLPGGQHQSLTSDGVLLEPALPLPVTANQISTSATAFNLHPTLCDPNNSRPPPKLVF